MTGVRAPAVAGTFYPGNPAALAATVDGLVATAAPAPGAPPRSLIAPHAGYEYSGPVAATAYRRVHDAKRRITRVVVLGPSHTVPLAACAVTAAETWMTPLGMVPVDWALRDQLAAAGLADVDDRPHRYEHAVEVHLPFLQRVLKPGWLLLPVVVGVVAPDATAALIDAVSDDSTLMILSSDLSHYLPYDAAAERDRETIEAIVSGDIKSLTPDAACGYHPVRGFLSSDLFGKLRAEVLDVRSSGDTAGDRGRVVGYAAIAFAE